MSDSDIPHEARGSNLLSSLPSVVGLARIEWVAIVHASKKMDPRIARGLGKCVRHPPVLANACAKSRPSIMSGRGLGQAVLIEPVSTGRNASSQWTRTELGQDRQRGVATPQFCRQTRKGRHRRSNLRSPHPLPSAVQRFLTKELS